VVIKELVALGSETPAYIAAFDEMFLEMAAQGQSAFDASGDEAAYDDYNEFGTTGLAVDSPADSPYITASGGTTLPFTGTLSGPAGTAAVSSGGAERTWGWDYTWAPTAQVDGLSLQTIAEDPFLGVTGSGGGFSSVESQPRYQQGVPGTTSYTAVPYFTSTNVQDIGGGVFEPTAFGFNPSPATIHGFGTGRAVPDLSTDADPLSGFLLYEPSAQPVLQPDWGGTSFVAPQLNGSAAVIDSYVGHRVGFWNPSIYKFATQRNSPFGPLNTPGTSNDNLFFTGTPGTVYNPGSASACRTSRSSPPRSPTNTDAARCRFRLLLGHRPASADLLQRRHVGAPLAHRSDLAGQRRTIAAVHAPRDQSHFRAPMAYCRSRVFACGARA
jgi:subtilase family serine protease